MAARSTVTALLEQGHGVNSGAGGERGRAEAEGTIKRVTNKQQARVKGIKDQGISTVATAVIGVSRGAAR